MLLPGLEGAMKSEPRPQQSDPPTPPLSLRNVEHLNRQMQQRWEMEEHLAIAQRAYELFEARGCEHGHDWEDWFRAESELHLNGDCFKSPSIL